MRSHRLALLTLSAMALVGLALGIVLAPGRDELARMNLKAERFAEAGAVLGDASGEPERGTLYSRAQVLLARGDADGAVALAERYVSAHPQDREVERWLADLYRAAMRPGDLRRLLERRRAAAPDAETLRALARLYEMDALAEAEEGALLELDRRFGLRAPEAERLGMLLASRGEPAAAAEALLRAGARGDAAVPPSARRLAIRLLLDLGRAPEAAEEARRWIASAGGAADAALGAAGLFAEAGRPAEAAEVLAPFAAPGGAEAPVLARAAYRVQAGDPQGAADALRAWRASAPALGDRGRFVAVALAAGAADLALAEGARGGLAGLGDAPAMELVASAYRAGPERRELADSLYAALPPEARERRPLAAAELALLRGERAEAEAALARASAAGLSAGDRLAAGNLYYRLGRPAEALAALRPLVQDPGVSAQVASDVGFVFLEAGQADDGAAMFDALRKERADPVVHAAWARLAAKAGRFAEVAAWLAEAGGVGDDLLRDLCYLASESAERGRGGGELAVAAAGALESRAATPENGLLLARALLLAGRYAAAAARAEPLAAAGAPDAEGVLLQAWRKDGKTDRLRAHWTAKLAAAPAGSEERKAALFALLDLGPTPALLPELRAEAERGAEDWLHAYVKAALRLGAREEAAALLRAECARTDLEPKRQAARLGLLLEAAPEEGLALLRARFEREPGRWAALYIDALRRAGRKGEAAAAIRARLGSPDLPEAEREQLVHDLVDAAGAQAALPQLRALAEEKGGAWTDAYAEALGRAGDRDAAAAFLAERAKRADAPPEERRAAASRLVALGRKAEAIEALMALSEAGGPDSEDLRQALHLSGPRPSGEVLERLARRAEGARGAERAAWMALLLRGGGARQAAAVVDESGAPAGPEEAAPYAEALASLGRNADLEKELARAAERGGDAETLRAFARIASRKGVKEPAERLWRAVLAQAPEDRDALREVAMRAFERRKFDEAAPLLARLTASGPAEPEALLAYGDALAGSGKKAEAGAVYARALEAGAGAGGSFSRRRAEATLLARLGRLDESIAAFESILKERPNDAALRADYAAVLLEGGRADRARELLGGPSKP